MSEDATNNQAFIRSYLKWLRRIGSLLTVALTISALVGAFLFLDYFQSAPNVEFDIRTIDVTYDEMSIVESLRKFKVPIPQEVLGARGFPRESIVAETNSSDLDFRSRWRATVDLTSPWKGDPVGDLEDAVEFAAFDRAAPRRDLGWFLVVNRAYWESEFPRQIKSVVDSTTYLQALRCVIAGRIVHSQFVIHNSGDIAAKDVCVTFQAPWLLKPRDIMTDAKVEFRDLIPDDPICRVSNHQSWAEASIAFLRVGEQVGCLIRTSMMNPTRDNIFVDVEPVRSVDPVAFTSLLLVGLGAYYFLPLVFALAPRLFTAHRSQKNRETAD